RTSWRASRQRSSALERPATRTPPRPPTPGTSSSAPPTSAASCEAMSRDPRSDQVARFIEQQRLLEPAQPVLALVSGGADSLCVWGVLRELGYEVEALHVEHGLRGEAGLGDAAFCAGLGAAVEAVDLEPGGNLEARARGERYGVARRRAGDRPV